MVCLPSFPHLFLFFTWRLPPLGYTANINLRAKMEHELCRVVFAGMRPAHEGFNLASKCL